MPNPKNIIIIGAGFAGLNAAKVLAKCPQYKVILIDKSNHHLFQPLLYQVATAALSPADIAMPVREIFRKYAHIETLMGTVIDINKEQKKVLLENGQQYDFEYLILAPGARHSYFGKDEWEPFAPGLKTLEDAELVREKILASFERAERTENGAERNRLLTFMIVGGGPTGVEMAGAIAEIAHHTLKNNYRHIDLNDTKIYLVEGSGQLLNGYPQNMANRAQRDLEKKKVTVLLNSLVTEITHEGVSVNKNFMPVSNVIWAAGNAASPLLKKLNMPMDRQGRVLVEKDLSIPGYENIFVLGDAACLLDKTEKPLPAIAPVAVQQGHYAGTVIKKGLHQSARAPFRYVDRGMMATIGKYDALVLSGPLQCSGFIAWLAWCFVHIYFLIGYRTKLFVFLQWAFYFFKGERNIRLIFKPLEISKDA